MFKMGDARRDINRKLWLLAFIGVFIFTTYRVSAQDSTRQTKIIVKYVEHEWWLMRWSDNTIACQILIDHEGLPTIGEVHKSCGTIIGQEWQNTPPCKHIIKGNNNTTSCGGFYLHQVSSQPKQREVLIDLPPSLVWITLEGCTPEPPENFCRQMPSIQFIGEEPLPNEQITAIHGIYDGFPFSCKGDQCSIPLSVTPEDGILVEFWADSSYGDTSQIFSARVRVIETGITYPQGRSGWYVDILSSQWKGAEIASCAQTWQAFPPIGSPPAWLSTPNQTKLLASDEAYFYLAGRLIAQGVVQANQCPSGGLLPNGYANACGLETSKDKVEAWQNQFDARIIEVSQNTGVPGQLMKNLFAQESQFWPGVFRVTNEFGLGQITDNGTDAILLWNSSFYEQFCPLVLAQDTCDKGYLRLAEDEQALLRGALAIKANANCPTCPAGVDLTNVDFSVSLFADTLLANCEQVAQVVYNASGKMPGVVSTYEDLWRFTIANYHAGPGCLSFAVYTTWNRNQSRLSWGEVAQSFTIPCQGVVPYVDNITK